MAAARNGRYGAVDLLLERGANPDMQDHVGWGKAYNNYYYSHYVLQGGWSALMAAVYKRHDEVALRIIQAGATPHLQDKVTWSMSSHINLTHLLSWKNKTNAVLLAIGRRNEEKVVNALLDSNPDVDLQDSVSFFVSICVIPWGPRFLHPIYSMVKLRSYLPVRWATYPWSNGCWIWEQIPTSPIMWVRSVATQITDQSGALRGVFCVYRKMSPLLRFPLPNEKRIFSKSCC